MKLGRYSLATLGVFALFFVGCSRHDRAATSSTATPSKAAVAQRSTGDLTVQRKVAIQTRADSMEVDAAS